MPIQISITDETAAGKATGSLQLQFSESLVTVATIIEQRVRTEVERHNHEAREVFYGLVQPSESETALNGFRQKTFRPIDADKQVAVALEAFRKNGFFLLIDQIQAEDLEQTFLLHQDSQISFVKLTPLVGG